MKQTGRPIEFVTRARAKFSELDPYGHVNTQHYLSYYLDHRFTGLRERLGLDLKKVARYPVLFVTRKIQIEFLKPLFADDEFEIRSHVQEFQERTCTVTMSMQSSAGTPVSQCTLELACVDRKTGAVVPWPEDLVAMFFESSSAGVEA